MSNPIGHIQGEADDRLLKIAMSGYSLDKERKAKNMPILRFSRPCKRNTEKEL